MKKFTSKSFISKRGYTIVEMGIVLAVLGLLLGASVVPLGRSLESKQVEKVENYLDQAQEAVIGFAMNNQTAGGLYPPNINPWSPGNRFVRTTVPGGRPYLPCPDITGDGHEDRFDSFSGDAYIIDPTPTQTSITVDYRASLINLQRPETERVTFQSQLNFILRYTGSCFVTRGNIPWATLGIPQTDPWGNQLSYGVDAYWSNSRFGFGPESRINDADTFLILRILTPPVSGPPSGIIFDYFPRTLNNPYTQDPISRSGEIMNVCTELIEYSTSGVTPACYSTRQGSNPGDYVLNRFAQNSMTVFSVFPQITVAHVTDAILDGMAFVIVSHGKNGRGAIEIDYLNNSCTRNDRGHSTNTMHPEDQNSVYSTDAATGCQSTFGPYNQTQFQEEAWNGYIYQRPHDIKTRQRFLRDQGTATTGDTEFDDRMRFMSGAHLLGVMRKRGADLGEVFVPVYESLAPFIP